ncbi:MAG: SufD family Fe-S cluster assembly protein [Thermoleophilia bacterium]
MSPRTADYQRMLAAYSRARGDASVFEDSRIAHLVVHQNRVIGAHLVPGLTVEPRETAGGVDLRFAVAPGVKIEHPVHLCFGVLPTEGEQTINITGEVGEAGGVDLLAHCIFPNAVRVRHQMQAAITIGRNASYGYDEVHYHGESGGVSVIPRARITLADGARLRTSFQLTDGRVGELDIDYEVEAAAGAVVEMLAKVYGYGNDIIRIREKCLLQGDDARGAIKSRVAVTGEARSEVFSEMEAAGRRSQGHVDCIEIVQDRATARAVPVVNVLEHTAKVTHEAAIGSVDSRQLETLMARGLDQARAVDTIIRGMLTPGH